VTLIFFGENAILDRERIVRAQPKRRRAGTRHFRTDLNISSFDRNATPAEPDDESGRLDYSSGITPVFSMACIA
jgi:hypothetical protein